MTIQALTVNSVCIPNKFVTNKIAKQQYFLCRTLNKQTFTAQASLKNVA